MSHICFSANTATAVNNNDSPRNYHGMSFQNTKEGCAKDRWKASSGVNSSCPSDSVLHHGCRTKLGPATAVAGHMPASDAAHGSLQLTCICNCHACPCFTAGLAVWLVSTGACRFVSESAPASFSCARAASSPPSKCVWVFARDCGPFLCLRLLRSRPQWRTSLRPLLRSRAQWRTAISPPGGPPLRASP